MAPDNLALLARVAVGFALAYVIGFERQLRGSAAGDRTFSLVGAASAAITAVAARNSPQAIAGVITGVGFIGAGVVFRGTRGLIRGITSAATIFAVAGVGIVVGFGHLALGAITAAVVLFTLEIQHLPILRWLDASTYSHRFAEDRYPTSPDDEMPTGP